MYQVLDQMRKAKAYITYLLIKQGKEEYNSAFSHPFTHLKGRK